MGINPASLGYVYPPQQQGSNTTSRVATGVKAGLFSAGAAGAVTYFSDFKGLTPVDANGNLFTEGLHIFEDASVQKGIKDASFDAQKTFLGKNNINIAKAEDLAAWDTFAKSGTVADSQKSIIEGLQAAKKQNINAGISNILRSGTDKQLERMNAFLKANGFEPVKEISEARDLLGKITSGEKSAIINAQVQKDVATSLKDAADMGKKASSQLARTTSIDGATKYLKQLELRKANFEALPATEEGILELLKKESGKTGEELNKILPDLSKKANRMFKSRTAALAETGEKSLLTKIAAQKGIVDKLQSGLQAKFASHFDKARGVLKETAPKELVKYFKNFKWAKAGKYALIAGAVAAIGGLLFGGNKA